jgi:muramoyltetrapeptide carboxypeptidase
MSAELRKPRALSAGDRVAIVAPASGFDRAEFDAGAEELRALGFEPAWDDSVFERGAFTAGAPDVRAAALNRAWQSDEVAALIGARGGYGSVQVLPDLEPSRFANRAKAFIGYSDLTSILTFLVCQCGTVAFHGPTVAGRLSGGAARYDRDSFMRILTEPSPAGELDAGPTLEVLRAGELTGRLMGGTLTQLAAACGTPHALAPWDDTILLLEDVNERPYRIDRLFHQLRLSGALSRVRGIVLGVFPGCDEPDGTVTARHTLANLLNAFSGPVVFGFPTGHVPGPAVTVPLGVRVRLIADRHPRLVVEEAAVVSGSAE